VARPARQVDRIEGLAQRADLVDLDQDRVRDPALDPLLEDSRVGDEEIVATSCWLFPSRSLKA
jgi:hypothetical protein